MLADDNIPQEFLSRMKHMLGKEYDAFVNTYSLPPARGLRVNTLKTPIQDFCDISPWELKPTNIIDEGFIVDSVDGIGRHPFHLAGLFYMQEPSAMSVVDAACISENETLKILDLCAAPGGKTGGMASRMNGNGIIVSNEIVPQRAKLLARNIERLGIPNSAVTCSHPNSFAENLPGFFDRVLVDAPCSGEGMFRKDPGAVTEWSTKYVSACAIRQRAILASAAECVAPNGLLIYSTCTFSREENECVIDDFLRNHRNFTLELTKRLYPHACVGEGHFIARLRCNDTSGNTNSKQRINTFSTPDNRSMGIIMRYLDSVIENPSECISDYTIHMVGDKVILMPANMPFAVSTLRPVAVGVEIGSIRKGRIIPSHTFYMAQLGQKYRMQFAFTLEDPRLYSYLSGNTFSCDDRLHGYCAVAVAGKANNCHNIGFGKAVDGVVKNHLPKGLYLL